MWSEPSTAGTEMRLRKGAMATTHYFCKAPLEEVIAKGGRVELVGLGKEAGLGSERTDEQAN